MQELYDKHLYEAIVSGVILLVAVVIRTISVKLINKYALVSEILEHRKNLVIKYISILITVLTITALLVIWGVKAENIFTTFSTVLTLIGVALFAQWSVLSNITSGMIILFSFPFKIGDMIRIHDKDFPIEAEIEDIRTFHTLLRTRDGEKISYPNNLLLQKGISIITENHKPREFTD
mgnify:CR=1 FL=1